MSNLYYICLFVWACEELKSVGFVRNVQVLVFKLQN